MCKENVFTAFGRPSRIPEDVLASAQIMVSADEEYVRVTRDVGRLFKRTDPPRADEDLLVLARMFLAIAERPSTASPVLIGIVNGSNERTFQCVR